VPSSLSSSEAHPSSSSSETPLSASSSERAFAGVCGALHASGHECRNVALWGSGVTVLTSLHFGNYGTATELCEQREREAMLFIHASESKNVNVKRDLDRFFPIRCFSSICFCSLGEVQYLFGGKSVNVV
jgi:hypothetical protein